MNRRVHAWNSQNRRGMGQQVAYASHLPNRARDGMIITPVREVRQGELPTLPVITFSAVTGTRTASSTRISSRYVQGSIPLPEYQEALNNQYRTPESSAPSSIASDTSEEARTPLHGERFIFPEKPEPAPSPSYTPEGIQTPVPRVHFMFPEKPEPAPSPSYTPEGIQTPVPRVHFMFPEKPEPAPSPSYTPEGIQTPVPRMHFMFPEKPDSAPSPSSTIEEEPTLESKVLMDLNACLQKQREILDAIVNIERILTDWHKSHAHKHVFIQRRTLKDIHQQMTPLGDMENTLLQQLSQYEKTNVKTSPIYINIRKEMDILSKTINNSFSLLNKLREPVKEGNCIIPIENTTKTPWPLWTAQEVVEAQNNSNNIGGYCINIPYLLRKDVRMDSGDLHYDWLIFPTKTEFKAHSHLNYDLDDKEFYTELCQLQGSNYLNLLKKFGNEVKHGDYRSHSYRVGKIVQVISSFPNEFIEENSSTISEFIQNVQQYRYTHMDGGNAGPSFDMLVLQLQQIAERKGTLKKIPPAPKKPIQQQPIYREPVQQQPVVYQQPVPDPSTGAIPKKTNFFKRLFTKKPKSTSQDSKSSMPPLKQEDSSYHSRRVPVDMSKQAPTPVIPQKRNPDIEPKPIPIYSGDYGLSKMIATREQLLAKRPEFNINNLPVIEAEENCPYNSHSRERQQWLEERANKIASKTSLLNSLMIDDKSKR